MARRRKGLSAAAPLEDLPAATWAVVGLGPLPVLAPSYRLISAPTPTVHVVTFEQGGWRTDVLDERWVYDATDTDDQGEQVLVGDLVCWVGPGVDGSRRGTYVWPPSLVTEVEVTGDGNGCRIYSIRDAWLDAIRAQDLPPGIMNRRALLKGAGLDRPATNEVLQWWGLDVWCPACGVLGQHLAWGMSPPPDIDSDGRSASWAEAWETASAVDAGCALPSEPPGMVCPRCRLRWGSRPMAGYSWPESDEWAALVPITDPESFRQLGEFRSLQDAAEAIACRVEPMEAQLQADGHGVRVELAADTCFLAYPFTMNDFWVAVDATETRSLMRLACTGMEREIAKAEGFEVRLFPGDVWPGVGYPELPEYPYVRAAPDDWTFDEWVTRRLGRVLRAGSRHEFDVEAWAPEDTRGDETLGELRAALQRSTGP